jgi:hypothetical protein
MNQKKRESYKLTPDEKIVKEAKDRFKICSETSSEIRKEALIDLNFIDGKQWDSQIMQNRQESRRPTLTINKLRVYINQVINDIRQNRPAIKVRPVDDGTDVATAKVINGIIRHICNNGNYKNAIDNATKYAVGCGMGYVRIATDYLNDNSFDQEFEIKIVDNPFLVYFPLNIIKELDYSDAPYAFIRMTMSKEDFQEKYPDADDMGHWQSETIGDRDWTEENDIWLAEYFKVIDETKTLYQLSDGSTTMEEPVLFPGLTVVKTRPTKIRKVMWYLLSEHTVLDREELVFSSIPIVPILGQDYVVDNKKRYYSLIRDSIDPQRLYNFWKSSEAELLMLTPKAVWMGAKGAFDGLENAYKEANAKPIAFLEYNPSTNLATPAAPPTRIQAPEITSAFIAAANGANEDIRATTGLFAASMGEAGAEKSGKAILARQRQGDTANFHFFESVNVCTRRIGRLLINGIPRIYDTVRTIRIIGEDSTEDVVTVNQQYHDEKTGMDRLYDLTCGEYDVVVDTSTAYETKRIESLDILSKFMTSFPPAAQAIGDLLAKNLDIPEAREMADRLRRMVPPNLLEDPNQPDNGIDEAQVRAIIADLEALQQQLKMTESEKAQLEQMLGQATAELKSKQEETQVKADSNTLKVAAEVRKAELSLEQEKVRQHGQTQQHLVTAAMDMHKLSRQESANLASENYSSFPTTSQSGQGE